MGHYSVSFLAKTVSPKTPLWIFFLAAMFVDIIGSLLFFAGIEEIRLVPGLPSNPLDLHFMPYSHSLFAAGIWAAAAFVLAYFTPKIRLSLKASLIVACGVAAHWLLDLIVHRPDLEVVSGVKVGLGLWNFPVFAFLLEVILLVGTLLLYVRFACPSEDKRRIMILGTVLLAVQVGTSFGPIPPSLYLIYGFLLVSILACAGAAKYVERGGG